MNKILYIIPSFLALVACSSFEPDYVIREASNNSKPTWTAQENAHKSDDSSNKEDYRYFNAEAQNPSQRLCLKSAEVRASQKIASEVAQQIMSKYNEASRSQNDDTTTAIEERLEQHIKANLHGVTTQRTYWEKRQYLEEMGAQEDKVAYKCDAVVKISNESLASLVNAYKKQSINGLEKSYQQNMQNALEATAKLISSGEPL